MAAIHRLFNKQLQIKRLKATTGDKTTYQSTATVDGHFQELDQQARQKLDIIEDRAWMAWVDLQEDIREGDYMDVVFENGHTERYLVTEVTPKDYGVNAHLQVVLKDINK